MPLIVLPVTVAAHRVRDRCAGKLNNNEVMCVRGSWCGQAGAMYHIHW